MKLYHKSFKQLYFIFLLPFFFVLNGYVKNFPLIPLSDAFFLTIQYLLISLLLLCIFYLVSRSLLKAALFSSVLMCFQFFFGWFHDNLKSLLPQSFLSKYSFVIPLIGLSIAFIFILIKRKKEISGTFISYLNITLLILVLFDTGILASRIINQDSKTEPKNFSPCNNCLRPNLYLIIADEYASNKSLQDLFSYDNSLFENELRKRGFFVAPSSTSNYNFTPYSMASIFDMNYLEGITAKSNDRQNLNKCFDVINNSELIRIFKKLDYEFINLSLFDFAGEPAMSTGNNFYSSRAKLITSQTLTGRLKKDLVFHLAYTLKWERAFSDYLENQRREINHQYQATINASKKTGKPRFVYTHFIMPHYPYLYDEYGSPLSKDQALNGGKKEYLGFLQYGNKKLLSLIDEIKKNDPDPVIVLMSDHGFTKYDVSNTDSSYNFKNMFNIYLPDKRTKLFSDSISNVNVFRVLLNTQFNQKLPLLKDSTVFLREY